MKIVIAGYYGCRNLGDEAILAAMVMDIRAVYPHCDVVVVSWDPPLTEATHGVRAVSATDPEAQVKELTDCDLAVLGGGGLFQDHHRVRVSDFFKTPCYGVTGYARPPLMARMLGKKVLYYSHGVGPLFSREAFSFCRWALTLADRMTVRDAYSYFLATRLLGMDPARIELGFDPALKLPLQPEGRVRSTLQRLAISEREILLVAPRRWKPKKTYDQVVDMLKQALFRFLSDRPQYMVIFLPFHTSTGDDDDIAVCRQIADGLPQTAHRIVTEYEGWRDALALMQAASLCLGIRYHSLLFAFRTGTPMAALSYDKKDEDLMRELDLEEYMLPFHAGDGDKLLSLLEKVDRDKATMQAHLSLKYKELRQTRCDSLTVLREMLETGRG